MGSENQVLIILPNKDFQDVEFLAVKEALSVASIEIKIASISSNECIGINGAHIMPDFTFDDIDTNRFDGVIFIGGPGTEVYIHEDSLHTIAQSFLKENKLVAAICWAPAILAYAGVLRGKNATAWEGAKDDLIKNGANFSDQSVVEDGQIITANGPDVAEEFGRVVTDYIIEQ